MLSDTLRRLTDERETSDRELAQEGGVSTDTVARYKTDETEPKFSTIRGWLRGLQSEKARLAIANAVVFDTELLVISGDRNLDIDGDGKVTILDAVRATGHAVAHLSPEIDRMLNGLQRGAVPSAYGDAFTELGTAAIGCITKAVQIVQQTPAEGERKSARPLPKLVDGK